MGIDIKEAHAEVSRRLDRLDFGALLPGFYKHRFALYNESQVCLGGDPLPRDGRFIANTAIEYEGQQIAIWKLTAQPKNYDNLAASLAHEMCHAFQVETRAAFPDEMIGAFYPRDLANFSGKYMENLLLAQLLSKFNSGQWDNLLRLRAARIKGWPVALDYELKAEGIEGQAKFVELAALRIFSAERYSEALGKIICDLKDPRAVFNARLCCYATGAALLAVAAANGLPAPDWPAEAQKPGAGAPAAGPDLTADFREYYRAVDELVSGALAKAEKIEPAGSLLWGFDPYNVRSSGNDLYLPHFIMCGEKGGKPHCSMGTYIAVMKGHTREIEALYKVKENVSE